MSDGMELLWIVVFVVVGAPLGAAFVLWKQMKAFGRPDLALKPANQSRHGKAMADSQSHDAWFVSQGFDIVACSTLNAMGNVLITAWQHRERPTYICIYHIANQRNYDIVTRFNDDIALTTGSTADGMLLPEPPGCYTQCFPKTPLTKMWQKHAEAEEFLMGEGASLATDTKPFAEDFVETLQEHSAHVQTIPFWPLRGLYWYVVRRGQLSGKTVQQLTVAGVYRRPSEFLHG